MPTELDVYAPERWVDDALFRPEVRNAYRRVVEQGWTDALRALHPGERIYTFWKYFRNAFARDAGLRIDHLLLSPAVAGRLIAAGVDRDVSQSLAGLSCRSPSCVKNLTSTTSSGRTQCTRESTNRDPNRLVGGGGASKGILSMARG
jgi:hypothetical protein